MIPRKTCFRWYSSRLVPCAAGGTAVASSLVTAAAAGTWRLCLTPTTTAKPLSAVSSPSAPRGFASGVGTSAAGALETAQGEQDQDCAIPRHAEVDAVVDADAPPPFVLPPPSWSLKDLNLGSRPAASAVELGPEQVGTYLLV